MFLVANTAKWLPTRLPIFDAHDAPCNQPMVQHRTAQRFYEGPSRCEWPFRAIYYHPIRHNERNFAMVVAGVVVVPLVASVVKRILWGGAAAIDQ